jgi:antirestriction protein ArdC
MAKTFDIYQTVTDKIIATLEKGVAPWIRPWERGLSFPYNAATKRPYSGINVFLLWAEAEDRGYNSPGWLTFNQAKQLGGSVRKGEKSTLVIFWKITYRKEKDPETGKDKERKIFYLRYYNVFNLDQIENLPEKFIEKNKIKVPGQGLELTDEFKAFVAQTGAVIKHGGDRAFYAPAPRDDITIPELKQFKSADAYAGVLLHEYGHWTGDKKRLNRDLTGRFGDASYAIEELIAEMSSAFLQPQLNVKSDVDNSAAYLKTWLNVLKSDKKAIFTITSQAKKASEYLLGKRDAEEVEPNGNGVELDKAA